MPGAETFIIVMIVGYSLNAAVNLVALGINAAQGNGAGVIRVNLLTVAFAILMIVWALIILL